MHAFSGLADRYIPAINKKVKAIKNNRMIVAVIAIGIAEPTVNSKNKIETTVNF